MIFFTLYDLLKLDKLYKLDENEWLKYHPIMNAVFDTIDEYDLSRDLFEHFFNAMKMDLYKYSYKTFTELENYMGNSTSTIGEIILCIMIQNNYKYNETRTRQLLHYSNDFSIAIKFTNIIKNISNDITTHIYIPTYFLDCYNIDLIKYNNTKIADNTFKDFMDCQINLNQEIYNNAQYGINELGHEHREIAQTVKNLNSAILNKIEDNDYNIFDSNNLAFYEQYIIMYKTLSFYTIFKILFNYFSFLV